MKSKRKQYWSELHKVCSESSAPLTLGSPSDGNRISANLGPNLNLGFRVEVLINAEILGVDKNNTAIRISVPKDSWKEIEKWGNITEKFDDESLIKPIKTGNREGGQQIILYKDRVDPRNESDWADQFEWFVENLSLFAELFRSCFNPDLPPFDVPKRKGVSKRESKDQKKLTIDEGKEYPLTSSDLLTLRKISHDLQALLAKYDD